MNTFYAAHNEYLEQLLTTGLLGLAAWAWFVAAHLKRAAQNWLRPGVAPVTLALVSYLAHAVVSIRVSMVFPEVMLLFGLLQVFCLPPEDAPAAAPRAARQAPQKGGGAAAQAGPCAAVGAAGAGRRRHDGRVRRGVPRLVRFFVLNPAGFWQDRRKNSGLVRANVLQSTAVSYIINLAVKSLTTMQRRENYDRILRTGQKHVPDHKRAPSWSRPHPRRRRVGQGL